MAQKASDVRARRFRLCRMYLLTVITPRVEVRRAASVRSLHVSGFAIARAGGRNLLCVINRLVARAQLRERRGPVWSELRRQRALNLDRDAIVCARRTLCNVTGCLRCQAHERDDASPGFVICGARCVATHLPHRMRQRVTTCPQGFRAQRSNRSAYMRLVRDALLFPGVRPVT